MSQTSVPSIHVVTCDRACAAVAVKAESEGGEGRSETTGTFKIRGGYALAFAHDSAATLQRLSGNNDHYSLTLLEEQSMTDEKLVAWVTCDRRYRSSPVTVAEAR